MSDRPLASSVPPPPAGSTDILLVDDRPSNLLSLEALLGGLSQRFMRATSGADALRLLLQRDFGLIILDVQMPGMDGLETARLIRQRKRSMHTPIIFITAYGADEGDVIKAYELGAVDFLFKPIVPEVLRAKVAVLMELQKRAIELARQAERLREHERREHERTLEQERQRWQAELMSRQIDELSEVDRRKDEFLAMLGHELRNPLTPVLAGLERLQKRFAETVEIDDSVRHAWDKMERQIRHLLRLVDDLLDVARISSGKIELQRTWVSFEEVIGQAVDSVQPLIKQHDQRLSVEMPFDKVMLHVDATRLTQVVSNLLTNAARYTDSGGDVRLMCGVMEGSPTISVVDNGQGIPAELLPRVFEMFTQEQQGRAGGLGIGLALVKRLVELHGGTVGAHSAGIGHGSEFVIRLPPSTLAVTAASPTSAASDVASCAKCADVPAGLRIAVIDDNADVREAIQDLLTDLGHRVEVAKDGTAGAELILRLQPHVALVDIELPDIDGMEVARRVRAKLDRDKVRLVATSGFSQDSHKQRAQEAGFDAFLIKPPRLEALQKIFSELRTH